MKRIVKQITFIVIVIALMCIDLKQVNHALANSPTTITKTEEVEVTAEELRDILQEDSVMNITIIGVPQRNTYVIKQTN